MHKQIEFIKPTNEKQIFQFSNSSKFKHFAIKAENGLIFLKLSSKKVTNIYVQLTSLVVGCSLSGVPFMY